MQSNFNVQRKCLVEYNQHFSHVIPSCSTQKFLFDVISMCKPTSIALPVKQDTNSILYTIGKVGEHTSSETLLDFETKEFTCQAQDG